MERRLGLLAILIENANSVSKVNNLLSEYSSIIDARLGLPMRGKGVALISLVVEGDTDAIGALSGKLGKTPGVKVKSVLTAYKEDENAQHEESGTRLH